MQNKTRTYIERVVITSVFCALAFVAVLIGRLIPNVAGFLSYDPKDAIVAIAGFIYGPLTSVFVSLIVSAVEMVTVSTTGIIGFVMNVISTCAFAVPAVVIYRRFRSMPAAFLGLAVGVLSMSACMLLWNWLITPLYMHDPRATVVGMLVPMFLPFNLIKGGINMGLTPVLYKPIVTALRAARLVPAADSAPDKKGYRFGFTLLSLFILAVFILLFLVFSGKI